MNRDVLNALNAVKERSDAVAAQSVDYLKATCLPSCLLLNSASLTFWQSVFIRVLLWQNSNYLRQIFPYVLRCFEIRLGADYRSVTSNMQPIEP